MRQSKTQISSNVDVVQLGSRQGNFRQHPARRLAWSDARFSRRPPGPRDQPLAPEGPQEGGPRLLRAVLRPPRGPSWALHRALLG